MIFNKSVYILVLITVITILSACGNNFEDDLQSTDWDVVATNGESYTAEFNKNTLSLEMGLLTRGFTYEIDDNEITLKEDGEEPIVFEIEEDGEDYFFEASTEKIKDEFGDLTLSPK